MVYFLRRDGDSFLRREGDSFSSSSKAQSDSEPLVSHPRIFSCGETGIRTPETLLTFTRFPGVPLQPLEHLSRQPVRYFVTIVRTKITIFYLASILFFKKNEKNVEKRSFF